MREKIGGGYGDGGGSREVGELEELTSVLQGRKPKVGGRDLAKWWLGSDGKFSLQENKGLIDEKDVVRGERVEETRWSKLLPKKIGILVWRVRLGRISCRVVLDKMGLDIDFVLCLRCEKERETVNHTLVNCKEVSNLWKKVLRWWNVNLENLDSVSDILECNADAETNVVRRKLWVEMVWSFVYLIYPIGTGLSSKRKKGKWRRFFLISNGGVSNGLGGDIAIRN